MLKPRFDVDKAHAVDRAKQERNIEMAKKLLKRNIDIDIILETTELSIEEIERIKKEMGL